MHCQEAWWGLWFVVCIKSVVWSLPLSQAVILHECTKLFAIHIFAEWLPNYTCHHVDGAGGASIWLSPHILGWPCRRERSYVVLTNNAKCRLVDFQPTIQRLFMKPQVDASAFLAAPKDTGKKTH